jgi:MYXO-CTERM domain-containing protein
MLNLDGTPVHASPRVLSAASSVLYYAPGTREYVTGGVPPALVQRISADSERTTITRMPEQFTSVNQIFAAAAGALSELLVAEVNVEGGAATTRVLMVRQGTVKDLGELPGKRAQRTLADLAVCAGPTQFGLYWLEADASSSSGYLLRVDAQSGAFLEKTPVLAAVQPERDGTVSCASNGESYLVAQAFNARTEYIMVRAKDGAFPLGLDLTTRRPRWTVVPQASKRTKALVQGADYRLASLAGNWTVHVDGATGKQSAPESPFPPRIADTGDEGDIALWSDGGLLFSDGAYELELEGNACRLGDFYYVWNVALEPDETSIEQVVWGGDRVVVAYRQLRRGEPRYEAVTLNGQTGSVIERCSLPSGARVASVGDAFVVVWFESGVLHANHLSKCTSEAVELGPATPYQGKLWIACGKSQCVAAWQWQSLTVNRFDHRTLAALGEQDTGIISYEPRLVFVPQLDPELPVVFTSDVGAPFRVLDVNGAELASVVQPSLVTDGLRSFGPSVVWGNRLVKSTRHEASVSYLTLLQSDLSERPLRWTRPTGTNVLSQWRMQVGVLADQAVVLQRNTTQGLELLPLDHSGTPEAPRAVVSEGIIDLNVYSEGEEPAFLAGTSRSGRMLVAYTAIDPAHGGVKVRGRLIDPAPPGGGAAGGGGASPSAGVGSAGRAGADAAVEPRAGSAGGGLDAGAGAPPDLSEGGKHSRSHSRCAVGQSGSSGAAAPLLVFAALGLARRRRPAGCRTPPRRGERSV